MKKKGFTMPELMISIGVSAFILAIVGVMLTSYTDTYEAGVNSSGRGDIVQTYFSYVVKDLTPIDEGSEENYIIIKKEEDSDSKTILIERSWHEDNDNIKKNVRYRYANGELRRSEYDDEEESITETRIISRIFNTELKDLDINIYQRSLDSFVRLTGEVEYDEVPESELYSVKGKRLGLQEDGTLERYNYYIEPMIKVGTVDESVAESEEFLRGYALRFAPELEFEEEEFVGIFAGPLATHDGGEFELKVKGAVRNSYQGQVAGRFKENASKSCTEVGGLEAGESDEIRCVSVDELDRMYIPSYGSLNGITSVNLELGSSTKTLNTGIYKAKYLKIDGKNGKLKINGDVKIYLDEGTDIVKGSVEYVTEDSQLLIIVIEKGKEFKIGDGATFEGYAIADKGNITNGAKMIGGLISGYEVVNIDDSDSHIIYDCRGRNITKEHVEDKNAIWWEE